MQRSRATLLLLFGVIIVDLVGFGVVMPVLPYWAEALDASGFELGLLLSGYAAAQFVCAPLWGRLSDRIGRRPVMLWTIAGTSLSLLALGLAESLPGLFAARLAAGAFAANISVAVAWLSDLTAPAERTVWMGRVGACYALGFTLGPAIGGSLGVLAYALPMLVASGLAALNFALASLFLREAAAPEAVADARETTPAAATARASILRDPVLRRLGLASLAFALAVTQLESMFQYLMIRRFAWGLFEVTLVLVAMAVWMGCIQAAALKPLARRYPERSLLIAGALLLSLAFALVPLAPSVALLLLPLALLATGRGIAQPSLMSLASMRAPATRRGVVMGAYQSSASLARVFGPALAGLLFDRAVALPFWLASALMLFVALLACNLPGGEGTERG